MTDIGRPLYFDVEKVNIIDEVEELAGFSLDIQKPKRLSVIRVNSHGSVEKHCSSCKKWKTREGNFHKKKSAQCFGKSDGFQYQCIDCRKKRYRLGKLGRPNE